MVIEMDMEDNTGVMDLNMKENGETICKTVMED